MDDVKKCSKCGETKSLSAFNRRTNRKVGYRCQCKACDKADRAVYYAENAKSIKEKKTTAYAENPERHRAVSIEWYKRNAEKAREVASEYRKNNPEKVTQALRRWRAENPDSIRIHNQNRRARKLANGGRLSPGLAGKLLKLQRGKCACCGVKLVVSHLDHVIPLALGGPNVDSNMQLLCGPCNLSKHAKHPVDFMQSRGFLL